MRATVTPILKFLEGSQQFVIPIYQRMYSWEKEHCQRLWNDVLRIGGHSEVQPHFFGSIVYMEPEEPQNLGDVRKLLVIDGQQRLATLSLLISALCRTINMRDYLTLKTERIPPLRKVYDKFRDYIPLKFRDYTSLIENPERVEETVKDIFSHAKHYVDLAIPQEEDQLLRECLEDIQELDVAVVYPFLLGVYEDYAQNRIERGDVIHILRLVESYIFRRSICDIPTRNINKTFATLMGRVDKGNYLESLKEAFMSMQDSENYPMDFEFRKALESRDIYQLKTCKYLLRKLENYGSKEPISTADYTIEHVMPQHDPLSEEWQQELGENFQRIHKDYLHTIGNLTLTGYNPELSNRPFHEKRNMVDGGFRYSPLNLNQSLAEAEKWDENAIRNRAKSLAQTACRVWIWADSA